MRVKIHPIFSDKLKPNYPNLLALTNAPKGSVITRIDLIGVFSKGDKPVPDLEIDFPVQAEEHLHFIRVQSPSAWLTCQINRLTGEILINTESVIADDRIHLELDVFRGTSKA